MKKLLPILLLWPILTFAEGPSYDAAPDLANNPAALQRGAKLFVNYCLNCHSAASMRYNRLRDIGLTEEEIKANLLFTSDKIGDTMKVALRPSDGKAWFGTAPPDLSVMARAKSPDYIYTYLRTYYRDPTRPTGWNNLAYPNTAMPHVLWQLQGVREAVFVDRESRENPGEKSHEFDHFTQVTPGLLDSVDYDNAAADLAAFMDYMSEPARDDRHRLGVWVLLFLTVLWLITWRLNAAFWKDVK
ncbi:MAG: cytochrome c1 [Burkholderiaceae bacterium]|jgi:ubiquinol-cytochrome c reductase cytochrome c1 subunit